MLVILCFKLDTHHTEYVSNSNGAYSFVSINNLEKQMCFQFYLDILPKYLSCEYVKERIFILLWSLKFLSCKNPKLLQNKGRFEAIHNQIGRRSILIKTVSGKTIYCNYKSTIGAPVVRNKISETCPGYFHQPQSSGGG